MSSHDEDKNFTPSWHIPVGLNHTPAYQVSGMPFASGSINCQDGPNRIDFPSVTRWINVINNDTTNEVKVAFSERALSEPTAPYFFIVPERGGAPGLFPATGPLEVKVSEIWLEGSTDVDIVAGLTTITNDKVVTTTGASWSGSIGVG